LARHTARHRKIDEGEEAEKKRRSLKRSRGRKRSLITNCL